MDTRSNSLRSPSFFSFSLRVLEAYTLGQALPIDYDKTTVLLVKAHWSPFGSGSTIRQKAFKWRIRHNPVTSASASGRASAVWWLSLGDEAGYGFDGRPGCALRVRYWEYGVVIRGLGVDIVEEP